MRRPRPLLRLRAALLALLGAAAGLSRGEAPVRPLPDSADRPVPLEDFFRARAIGQPQLNSAGTHLAALVNREQDHTDLVVFDLKHGGARPVAAGGERDVSGFVWLGDSHLLFQTTDEQIYGASLAAVAIADLAHPYPVLQRCSTRLIAVPDNDPLHPLVWLRDDPLSPGLEGEAVVLDAALDTGPEAGWDGSPFELTDCTAARDANERHILRRYPKPPGVSCSYTADNRGHLAFAYTCDAAGMLSVHELVSDHWIQQPLDLDAHQIRSCGEKPGELLVRGPRRGDRPSEILNLDVASGTAGRAVYDGAAHDFVGTFFRDPATGEITGYFDEGAEPRSVWFADTARRRQDRLDARFPGKVARVISTDRPERRILVSVYSDRQPADYYLFDTAADAITLFRRSAPWIEPDRMQPLAHLPFRTTDGYQLDAYLTLPAGASHTHPVPLVVLPHGGPWVQDVWTFDNTAQFLANRGYAVLQPNYRGSTGSEWMFPETDRWDFRKMHADVTAATRAALATGLVDPGRVAIMGSSFGGYLALTGATEEPGLYRCAVTIGGVFDWARVIGRMKAERSTNAQYAYLRRKLGHPAERKEYFDSISPVRRVDRIRVPVFVAHGEEDWVASASESRRLIAALRRARVPVETFLPAGEGHGMHLLRNRVELYRRIEDFLARSLAPRSQPVATTTP